MNTSEWLAEQFEAQRTHLHAVAYRMLGSQSEADDALQAAWIRLSGADTSAVENLAGWMTTIVARLCLDRLRARKRHDEAPLDLPDEIDSGDAESDPEREAQLSESVEAALLVILDTLAPEERLVLVLHDVFGMPFAAIAAIVGRSAEATRQLASRARRRVRGAPALPRAELERQRDVVTAFLAAARSGDLNALVTVLAPDVVLHIDGVLTSAGSAVEIHGAQRVAKMYMGADSAVNIHAALVNGAAGLIVGEAGRLLMILYLAFEADGRIARIEAVSDEERLRQTDVAMLNG